MTTLSKTMAEPDGTWEPSNWQSISVHDESNVRGFFGPYRWMSNFQSCPCEFEGQVFPSSENAYQAAKVAPPYRLHFLTCSAKESKKLWKNPRFVQLYNEETWDVVKLRIMKECLTSKFLLNADLRRQLVATGDRYLEETLWWKDTFWGYDVNLHAGANNLGRLLMKTRTFWQ